MSWRARLVRIRVVFDLDCKPLVVIQQVKRIAFYFQFNDVCHVHACQVEFCMLQVTAATVPMPRSQLTTCTLCRGSSFDA